MCSGQSDFRSLNMQLTTFACDGANISDRDWEDMKKMPEHQTLVKDFKKIKYGPLS